jgi:anti-sigma factor RsiW
MACSRAEELFSDHLESSLAEPLLSELEAHLAACAGCRELRQFVGEVVESLRGRPAVEPPAALAGRAAAAALAAARGRRASAPPPVWNAPVRLLPLAAALALCLVGGGLLWATPGSLTPVRHLVRRSVLAREYVIERGERLVEDLRLIRVVVGTALEDRLDRVNDRVEDYRRLLQQRKKEKPAGGSSVDTDGFQNFASGRLVEASGRPGRKA